MAEGCIKLIAKEIDGPTSVKFSFSIILLDAVNARSPILDVCNIAEIDFFVDQRYTKLFIQVRKFSLAMELGLHLHVVCDDTKFDSNLLCTEEWSTWQPMGRSENTSFNVRISLIMSKADLMALKLYKDEEFTDFQLSTAEGSVAVHKAQLAANSEVFKTMLTREWKETTEGCIKMEGVTLKTLQYLKDYMYLGALSDDGLCPLLLIARCYLMDDLKAACLKKLHQTVKSANLYDILEFSFFNKFPELTFAVLGATSKSMVDDASKIMIEKQKICKNTDAEETAEQEQSNEETNE